jgi:hypothetical protein
MSICKSCAVNKCSGYYDDAQNNHFKCQLEYIDKTIIPIKKCETDACDNVICGNCIKINYFTIVDYNKNKCTKCALQETYNCSCDNLANCQCYLKNRKCKSCKNSIDDNDKMTLSTGIYFRTKYYCSKNKCILKYINSRCPELHNMIKCKFDEYEETIVDLEDQFTYIPGNEKALEAEEDFESHLQ